MLARLPTLRNMRARRAVATIALGPLLASLLGACSTPSLASEGRRVSTTPSPSRGCRSLGMVTGTGGGTFGGGYVSNEKLTEYAWNDARNQAGKLGATNLRQVSINYGSGNGTTTTVTLVAEALSCLAGKRSGKSSARATSKRPKGPPLAVQADASHRISVSLAESDSLQLTITVLNDVTRLHACKQVTIQGGTETQALDVEHRARPNDGRVHETLSGSVKATDLGRIDWASAVVLNVCDTSYPLEDAFKDGLSAYLGSGSDAGSGLHARLPIDADKLPGALVVFDAQLRPEGAELGLELIVPASAGGGTAAACEVAIVIDGNKLVVAPFTFGPRGRLATYRTTTSLADIGAFAEATRVVGKVCQERFEVTAAARRPLRDFILRVKEEQALQAPATPTASTAP